MHRNNRNLFPFIAVLTAAGTLSGICSIFFLAIDNIGSARVGSVALSPSPLPSSPLPSSPLPSSPLPSSAQSLNDNELSGAVLDVTSPSTPPHTSGTHTSGARTLGTHKTAVLSTRSNGQLVASGSYDNTVKIWSLKNLSTDLSAELSTEEPSKNRANAEASLAHNGHVNTLTFIPNRLSSGELSRPAERPAERPADTDYSLLATGSGSGEIKLWDLASAELMTTIADRSGRIMSLATNADGTFIASGSSNGALKVWPVEAIATQKSQTNLRGIVLSEVGTPINTLAFHPSDPNILVSGDQSGDLTVWNIAKPERILTLASNTAPIMSLAMSPDGRYIASGSDDTIIRIWNLQTGRIVRMLSGHNAVVSDVAFSPNGKLLVSSSYDGSIKTWDWEKDAALCTLKGHTGFVYSLAFANSSSLVSGGDDGTVRTWNLTASADQNCLI